ncbi:MAG: NADPH-dependent glutamate synthase [Candidatus Brocadiia bacterium]
MYEILAKEKLAPKTYQIKIHAPRIAQKRKAGQFVVLRLSETGERIPLTIAGGEPENHSITVVFQAVGNTTEHLATFSAGDEILDVAGPLGKPTELHDGEHAVCVGGGLGIALILPLVRAIRAHMKGVTGIISARSEELLIMEKELAQLCEDLQIATDDGSKGYHGFPTDLLKEMLQSNGKIDAVYAVGPVPMMAAISDITRPFGVKTIVSLNPIMLDGTGMCGGCRVTIGGETKFACVDGPEFDGHQVDFEELRARLAQYEDNPRARELPQYEPAHECDQDHTDFQNAKLQAGREAEKSIEIPRQPMPEQPADKRINNFVEVPFGLRPEQAVMEANRCLQCKKPKCVEGCPVGIDIPGFIKLITQRKFADAASLIKEDNALPAVCGRVCPQEDQCEANCVLGRKADPVAIGNLERFVADYERENDLIETPNLAKATKERIAIVGSGPAGLTAAGELARLGYQPVIHEALHEPGGVLTYGIPQFRLPKEIVAQEVDFIKSLGVEIRTNFVVGKTASIRELFDEGFAAVFVGSGAGLPILVGTAGENLNGVLSANEYLTRVNLMRAYDTRYETPVLVRPRIAVLGGGNVAMDSARTALRLGADEVTVLYRRSEEECPARQAELEHAMEEDVDIRWLTNVVEILGDSDGWVKGVRCIQMELGEPGEDGRRRPYPIEGSEFEIPMDMVIIAFGNRPHPLIPQTTKGLEVDKWGTIVAEPGTGKTTLDKVYAGGDIVTGAATVIQAMGAGKDAAHAIDADLHGKRPE